MGHIVQLQLLQPQLLPLEQARQHGMAAWSLGVGRWLLLWGWVARCCCRALLLVLLLCGGGHLVRNSIWECVLRGPQVHHGSAACSWWWSAGDHGACMGTPCSALVVLIVVVALQRPSP